MNKRLFVLLLFYSNFIYGQVPVVNEELKSLIQQSFSYFPKVKELEQATYTNDLKVDLNNSYRRPTVVGNATYNYLNPVSKTAFPVSPTELRTIQFFPYNNVNANIAVTYNVLDFGKIKANVEKAKAELQESRHNMDLLQSQLAAQTASIYYSIVFYTNAIAVQDSVLAYLRENYRVTESKFRHGDALKVDLLNIQSLIDSETNRKLDLQKTLQKNYHLLAYATGQDTLKGNKQFDFVYDNRNVQDLLKKASENNPEFLIAHDKVKISETELKVSRTQNRPNLSVLANAGFKNGYFPNIYQVRFNVILGASLTVPIYEGGRIRQQNEISSSLVKLNQLSVNSLENSYQKDMLQALDEIESTQLQLQNVEGQIAQAKEVQGLTASRYKNGTATYLDIINANSSYQRAHLGKLQYQYQLSMAYVELTRLSGQKYWQ
jgi:outer membrane protein TolC